MDVGAWLRGLGLGRYEPAFRDNGIDEQVLPHLTVEDLKEIGVATVGDRRKLLAAIVACNERNGNYWRIPSVEGSNRNGSKGSGTEIQTETRPAQLKLDTDRAPRKT